LLLLTARRYSSSPFSTSMASSDAKPFSAVHKPNEGRFVIADSKGQLIGAELTYTLKPIGNATVANFNHTVTPHAFRGQGLAGLLASFAFNTAKAQGWKVIPSCSYISDTFLPKNPQFEPLVFKQAGL